MIRTDSHGKTYTPMFIIDGIDNHIILTQSICVLEKYDKLVRSDGVSVLIEKVDLIEDLFENYWTLDVYVISNRGGTERAFDVLNIGDELRLLIYENKG